MHRGSLSIDRGINAIYRFIRFFLLYCNFLPTGSREEPYFSELITINPTLGQAPFQCMYPFIGTIIEKLIEQKNPYADTILSRCIEHNRNTYEIIKEFKDRKYGEGKNAYNAFRLHFFKDGDVIEAYDIKEDDFLVTNIIHINADLDYELIKDLNSYYDTILDIAREEGNYVF